VEGTDNYYLSMVTDRSRADITYNVSFVVKGYNTALAIGISVGLLCLGAAIIGGVAFYEYRKFKRRFYSPI
jgi:hypothetical protein